MDWFTFALTLNSEIAKLTTVFLATATTARNPLPKKGKNSIGSPRPFTIREKGSKSLHHVTAHSLDILKMSGNFERDFTNQILPSQYKCGSRLNFWK